MKKALAPLLSLVLLISLLAACAQTPAVEDVVAHFTADKTYSAQTYEEQMIETVRAGIEKNGITLSGEIVAVVHLVAEGTDEAFPWAYVYELAEESDAVAIEENRRSFVSSFAGGSCVRFGRVVVFGTSPYISTLDP